jgi:hypothetical protein
VDNNAPFKSEVAILVTSWMGHLKWLKYTLSSYRATGAFVLLAFDTHLKFDNIQSYEAHFPPPDLLAIPNAIVLKHSTFDADKRNGWMWNFIYGANTLLGFSNFKHILTINSDCAFDRPEGLPELIKLLGDGDYMSQAAQGGGEELNSVHTCSMLFKREALIRLADYFTDAMAVAGPESYSPEVLLTKAHKELRLKLTPTPEMPIFPKWHDFAGAIDDYQSYNEDSTWKKIMGFRNLCAENDTKGIERLPPIPAKYFDFRNGGALLSGYEREALYCYYQTGDLRYLWMHWDRDEDSWYDRRVYPVEHYGPEPVLDPNFGKDTI